MGDCDLDDDEYFEQPKTQEELEISNIFNECNLPLDRNVRLNEIVGKTIKFCKKTENRKNNTILIVFTDDTFLVLKNEWDTIFDGASITLDRNDDYQQLMIDGNLISQEKVDKFNNFFLERELKYQKERDLKTLKELLVKYPDFENK